MNKSQRVVVILYCLLLAYCSVWVPWRVPKNMSTDAHHPIPIRLGYGWLWIGPSPRRSFADRQAVGELSDKYLKQQMEDYPFVAAHDKRSSHERAHEETEELTEAVDRLVADQKALSLEETLYAAPDVFLMLLRFAAATAVAAAFFFLGGLWKSAIQN